MRGISIWANDSLVLKKNVNVLSLKKRENAKDHRSSNLLMAKKLHLTVGFILLLAFFRTTRTFSGHVDQGELIEDYAQSKLIFSVRVGEVHRL